METQGDTDGLPEGARTMVEPEGRKSPLKPKRWRDEA